MVAAAFSVGSSAWAGPRAAVLPLEAKSVLPQAAEELDRAVREAVAASGVEVQPIEDTRRHLAEAGGAGLGEACSVLTDECAVRVGLLAEVDLVVSAFVEIVDDRMVMRATKNVVEGGVANAGKAQKLAAQVALPSADGGAKVRALIRRLIEGKGEPTELPVRVVLDPSEATATIRALGPGGAAIGAKPLKPGYTWLMPGRYAIDAHLEGFVPLKTERTITKDEMNTVVTIRLDEEPIDVPQTIAVAVAWGGAGIALAGGATAAGVELALQQGVVSFETRDAAITAGFVGLAVAGVGVLLAAGGATALVLGGDEGGAS